MKRRYLSMTAVVGSVLAFQAVAGPAAAQEPRDRPYEERFWEWLQDSRYRQWAPWPGQDGDFYEGQEPHGALLKTYVNRQVAGHEKDPPHGSVIVKENYNKNKELMAITVMHRAEGFDPEHHDWYWVKYTADGRVDRQNGMKLAGKVKGCIQCHGTAKGDDFVFTNDAPAAKKPRPKQPKQKPAKKKQASAVDPARQAKESEAAVVVKMTNDLDFEPSKVTVKAGETIEWNNSSRVVHTVTADPDLARDPDHVVLPEGAEAFNSGRIRPGETYSRKLTVPGRYRYFCIPHEGAGMIGEVEVRPADE